MHISLLFTVLLTLVNATNKSDRKKSSKVLKQSSSFIAPNIITIPINQQIMNACGTKGYLFTDPTYARFLPSFHDDFRYMDMLQLDLLTPQCAELVTKNIQLFPHITHLVIATSNKARYAYDKLQKLYRDALKGGIIAVTIDFSHVQYDSWFFLTLLDDLRDDDISINSLIIQNLDIKDLVVTKESTQLRSGITRKLSALGRRGK